MPRNSHQTCSLKKVVLKNFARFIGKDLVGVFNKVVPTQVFSCEYCKIFKNTYFEEHPWMAASECCLQQQWRATFAC